MNAYRLRTSGGRTHSGNRPGRRVLCGDRFGQCRYFTGAATDRRADAGRHVVRRPVPSGRARAAQRIADRAAPAARRPLAVVLDNFYPDARPQAGLANASVVFDALTEGGITRLMALFLEHDRSSDRSDPERATVLRLLGSGFPSAFRSRRRGSGGAATVASQTGSLADVDALHAERGIQPGQ